MMKIGTVGVVGAGTMGAAIAQKFAQEGTTVLLADRTQRFIHKGMESIRTMLQQGVERKVFAPGTVEAVLGRITGTTDLKDLAVCDLVVEAIFEDREAKATLFRTLDGIVRPGAIVATNTSSFSVTELAASVSDPERFVGLHYFYHAAKNRLVEIIPGERTAPEVMEAVRRFCRRTGKDAIECRDAYGFVVNRYFVPWLNEAVRMHEEGLADIPTIDAACMKAFGIGMGPFALMNATGVPVAYHAQRTLEVFGPLYTVSPGLQRQTEAGVPWDLSGEASADQALHHTIADRMLGIVCFVCTQLLDEQVCDALAIERGARIGLRWRKGPIALMSARGEAEVRRMVGDVAKRYGVAAPTSIGPAAWAMEHVRLEVRNGVATITMDRPEDNNALNEEVMAQLDERFARALADPQVRTIALTGSGKAFVAGADIKFFVTHMKRGDISAIERFTAYGQQVFHRIDASPKPVVAVLNGLALGGGLELALCADIIMAHPKAVMAFPETGIGIYPGLGGTQRTATRVGKGLAKYLVHTGRMLNATDALAMGLIDGIVGHDDIDAILDGTLAPSAHRTGTPAEPWKGIAAFFERNGIEELLAGKSGGNGIAPAEVERILGTLQRKAPLALRIADKLITDGRGCASELEHLHTIFTSSDAMLGLSSIGKKVSYEGK